MDTRLRGLCTTVVARLVENRDEKGHSAWEYVGTVAVSAILLGAVVDALGNGGALTQAVRHEIRVILDLAGSWA